MRGPDRGGETVHAGLLDELRGDLRRMDHPCLVGPDPVLDAEDALDLSLHLRAMGVRLGNDLNCLTRVLGHIQLRDVEQHRGQKHNQEVADESVRPSAITGPCGRAARVVNGVLDGANAKNVTVTQASTTGTCLDVTTAQAPRNVVAMIDNSGANPATTSVAGTVNPTAVGANCPAGSDAVITTVESGTFTPKPFYVTFN